MTAVTHRVISGTRDKSIPDPVAPSWADRVEVDHHSMQVVVMATRTLTRGASCLDVVTTAAWAGHGAGWAWERPQIDVRDESSAELSAYSARDLAALLVEAAQLLEEALTVLERRHERGEL